MRVERLRRAVADTLVAGVGIAGLVLMLGALGRLGLPGVADVDAVVDAPEAAMWMVASFGASITLLLACPDSPLGRPYPALVGNVGSACVGVVCWKLLGPDPAWAAMAAVVGAVGFMSLAGAWHPPGGATAMLAVLGGPAVHRLGWWFALCPMLLGTVWLLGVAWVRTLIEGRRSA